MGKRETEIKYPKEKNASLSVISGSIWILIVGIIQTTIGSIILTFDNFLSQIAAIFLLIGLASCISYIYHCFFIHKNTFENKMKKACVLSLVIIPFFIINLLILTQPTASVALIVKDKFQFPCRDIDVNLFLNNFYNVGTTASTNDLGEVLIKNLKDAEYYCLLFTIIGTTINTTEFTVSTENKNEVLKKCMFPSIVSELFIFDSIYFAHNSKNLNNEGYKTALEIAYALENDKKHMNSRILIHGHTSEPGSTNYNNELGQERALAVRNKLIEIGISPNRIMMASYGEFKPILKGSEEKIHKKNRRVECYILPYSKQYENFLAQIYKKKLKLAFIGSIRSEES